MLNSQYRAKDKITDVLSFPVHDDLRKTVDPTVTNGGMLLLGDIFICEGVAIEQAKNNGISLRQEISELFIHGMLHLLGYDHELLKWRKTRCITLREKSLIILKN